MDDTVLTLMDILKATNYLTSDDGGILYGDLDDLSLTALFRTMANDVYSDINGQASLSNP